MARRKYSTHRPPPQPAGPPDTLAALANMVFAFAKETSITDEGWSAFDTLFHELEQTLRKRDEHSDTKVATLITGRHKAIRRSIWYAKHYMALGPGYSHHYDALLGYARDQLDDLFSDLARVGMRHMYARASQIGTHSHVYSHNR